MRNITPAHLRCGPFNCPAVFERPDGKLMIIGEYLSTNEAREAGANPNPETEGAVIIDRALLANVLPVARDNAGLESVLIGGNHLASSLVHTLGADFAERFPPEANPATMRDAIANRVNGMIGTSAAWIIIYDIWVAWSAIMRARAALSASSGQEGK